MKIDPDLYLYDKHMGGDELTNEELNQLAKWLLTQRDRAMLLGDGNLEEWYGNILNGVLTALAR